MKPRSHLIAFLACSFLMLVSVTARAEEIPVVTGEHWTKSTEQVKKAYLVGMANLLLIESAYEGASPPPDTQSIVPRFIKGLKGQGHTLDSVREGLDKWYAEHPDKLQRPVIEIIWFEMVQPGLKKTQ
jgi:hypothetical protein